MSMADAKIEAVRGNVRELLNNYPTQALKEMETDEPAWWWLSFADGEEFTGVVIVLAHGLLEAVRVCHEQRLCPGSEVLGTPIPTHLVPAEKYRHTILDSKQIKAFMPDVKKIAVNEDDSVTHLQ